MIISRLAYLWRLFKFKKHWRNLNSSNYTSVKRVFDENIASVGNYTYGTINLLSSNNQHKVHIGSFCSIASNVVFIINNDHPINLVSTYPFKVKIMAEKAEAISKGDIFVGDDVWIGFGATIMSGVNIGQGAVIAAGAVVTKDVPEYSVAAGVPAEVVKYRFSDETIAKLKKVDYSKIDEEFIKSHIDDFYKQVSDESVLDWLPKKNSGGGCVIIYSECLAFHIVCGLKFFKVTN